MSQELTPGERVMVEAFGIHRPRRVQLSRRKGWRKPENTVVVARPSKWGNPFAIGMSYGASAETLVSPRAVRGSVLAIPLADARSTLATPQPPVRELGLLSLDLANPALHVAQHSAVAWHGSTLDQPCHADVLLDLVNEAVPV